jgi:hypothetical protein
MATEIVPLEIVLSQLRYHKLQDAEHHPTSSPLQHHGSLKKKAKQLLWPKPISQQGTFF